MNQVKKLVVKVGTSTLTHENGRLDLLHIDKLVRAIADVSGTGVHTLLVSSGAIAVGVSSLGLDKRPTDIPGRQATAAVGQARLMHVYEKMFDEYGYRVGQILLSHDVLDKPDWLFNVQNTVNRLFEYNVIPIANENDTVAVDDIKIENDTLSATVAVITKADLLVLFSDIDGLYDRDPHLPGATLIKQVDRITDDIRAMAGGRGTERGTGGMQTKLKAAEIANRAGIPMILANGNRPESLYEILEGKNPGTIFLP